MTQEHKRVAVIDGKEYKVGYPQCAGCEHLCLPWPSECLYEGEGCEYPESRVKEEQSNKAFEKAVAPLYEEDLHEF